MDSNLFGLIKTMNTAEKKYFRQFARSHHVRGKSNTYLKLFDRMDNLKDEPGGGGREKIKSRFPIKNFSRNAHYLYRLLLKCLRIFHTGKYGEMDGKDLLHVAGVLNRKGLPSPAYALLNKVKKKAVEKEDFPFLLEVFRLEELLITSLTRGYPEQPYIAQLHSQRKETLKKLNNLYEYSNLMLTLSSHHIEKGIVRTREEKTELDRMMKNPLLRGEEKALSSGARYYFYRIWGQYYITLNDFEKQFECSKKVITLLEKEDKSDRYHSALYNHAIACVELKKYDEFMHTVAQLRVIRSRYKGEIPRSLQISILMSRNVELSMYIDTADFREGEICIGKMLPEMETLKDIIPRGFQSSIYYHFVCVYFGLGDFEKARRWLNKILLDSREETRRDFETFARLINLLLHFELGEYDSLEYFLKSTYRFLMKKGRLLKMEDTLLRYLREMIKNALRPAQLRPVFISLKADLEKLKSDPIEYDAVEFFDFLPWLESKITGRTFAEIIKEKSGKKETG